ncbi:hypothetical protein LTR95_015112 [Oleoguttula sp. CCFEE 5521]
MALTYGNSRKWINPAVLDKKKDTSLASAKIKICRNSPFFPSTAQELIRHQTEYAALLAADKLAKLRLAISPPIIRLPFSGILTKDSARSLEALPSTHSLVLGIRTLFTPAFTSTSQPLAPWPSRSELKYEGDDRVATDALHRRFLPLPRMPGNETVNWQHRNVVPQFAFEEFYLQVREEEVFERIHVVGEWEFGVGESKEWEDWVGYGDASGRDVIGWGLWDELERVGNL